MPHAYASMILNDCILVGDDPMTHFDVRKQIDFVRRVQIPDRRGERVCCVWLGISSLFHAIQHDESYVFACLPHSLRVSITNAATTNVLEKHILTF